MKLVPNIYGRKTSNAEIHVFELLKSINFLDSSIINDFSIALHSLNLGMHIRKRWAEGDFIVLSEKGILLLEIKGGRVAYKNGIWEFTNKENKVTKKIEGPGAQANSAFHSLNKNYLIESFKDELKGIPMGFGVVFESIDRVVGDNVSDLPELPDIITAYKKDCLNTKSFKSFINRLYSHYQKKVNAEKKLLSEDLMRRIIARLRPEFDKVPGIGYQINDLETQLYSFSEEQYAIYDSIIDNERIMIEGGAGSGKTFLAMAAARREADLDKKILFITRSPFLASHLNASSNLSNITIIDFNSLKELNTPDLFDVLIVDEGQDLCQMSALDILDKYLKNGIDKGSWRWFGDPNHQVSPSFLIEQDAMDYLKSVRNSIHKLNENIRNTPVIVKTLELYTKANIGKAKPKGIGGSYKFEIVDSLEDKYSLLFNYLKDWLSNENSVKRTDICVLAPNKNDLKDIEEYLNTKHIRTETISTKTMKAPRDSIKLSTVEEFKGLDCPIVCVWGLNNVEQKEPLNKYIYKAFSRANHTLLFIGTKQESDLMKQLYK